MQTTCVICKTKYDGEVERDICGLCVMSAVGAVVRGFTLAITEAAKRARERRELEEAQPDKEPEHYVN